MCVGSWQGQPAIARVPGVPEGSLFEQSGGVVIRQLANFGHCEASGCEASGWDASGCDASGWDLGFFCDFSGGDDAELPQACKSNATLKDMITSFITITLRQPTTRRPSQLGAGASMKPCQGVVQHGATRQGRSRRIGRCDNSMKLRQLSSRCESCLVKGEPARTGSEPCGCGGNDTVDA
jgi:hypothetical protein